jgi:hypothetical protein
VSVSGAGGPIKQISYTCLPGKVVRNPPKLKPPAWAIAGVLCAAGRQTWDDDNRKAAWHAGGVAITDDRREKADLKRRVRKWKKGGKQGPRPERHFSYPQNDDNPKHRSPYKDDKNSVREAGRWANRCARRDRRRQRVETVTVAVPSLNALLTMAGFSDNTANRRMVTEVLETLSEPLTLANGETFPELIRDFVDGRMTLDGAWMRPGDYERLPILKMRSPYAMPLQLFLHAVDTGHDNAKAITWEVLARRLGVSKGPKAKRDIGRALAALNRHLAGLDEDTRETLHALRIKAPYGYHLIDYVKTVRFERDDAELVKPKKQIERKQLKPETIIARLEANLAREKVNRREFEKLKQDATAMVEEHAAQFMAQRIRTGDDVEREQYRPRRERGVIYETDP